MECERQNDDDDDNDRTTGNTESLPHTQHTNTHTLCTYKAYNNTQIHSYKNTQQCHI